MSNFYEPPAVQIRRFFIDIGNECTAEWAEIAAGIASVKSSAAPVAKHAYSLGRHGYISTQPLYRQLVREFTGMRLAGNSAQDRVLLHRLREMDNCEIEYLEFYEGLPKQMILRSGNGWKGRAVLLCCEDGSAGGGEQEAVQFTLAVNGEPKRGTIHLNGEGQVPLFEPLWDE